MSDSVMRAPSYLLMLATLAFPAEAFAEDPPPGVRLRSEFTGFPALLTTFGGGMQVCVRVDIGYMSFWTLQGITVFGAARVGSGRRVDPDSDRSSLYGAQVGVTYWPFVGWWPHAGVVGLELQWNHTNYLGEWNNDLRFVLNINAGLLFIPLAAVWEAGIFGR